MPCDGDGDVLILLLLSLSLIHLLIHCYYAGQMAKVQDGIGGLAQWRRQRGAGGAEEMEMGESAPRHIIKMSIPSKSHARCQLPTAWRDKKMRRVSAVRLPKVATRYPLLSTPSLSVLPRNKLLFCVCWTGLGVAGVVI